MREWISSAKISRLAGAVGALWLLCTGPAWAGGGGADAGSLQSTLDGICSTLGIPCPQFPTYATSTPTPISPLTPIVLQLAAWENVSPDLIRLVDSDCGLGTPGPQYCPLVAVNATNPPAKSPISEILGLQLPTTLASLTSLAFISNPAPMVPLTVTQNPDPKATSYVYAIAEEANGQPERLDLVFENVGSKGPGVLTVALPLAVLVNNAPTENSVVATLTTTSSCNIFVCPATVSVNFGMGKNTYNAASLGINVVFFFGPTANSATPHPIYEVQIPILVNKKTDPIYFLSTSLPGCPDGSGQFSGYCNAFSQTNPPNGFAPKFLPGKVVGMAPSAAPQCPGNQPVPNPPVTTCPTQSNPATAPIAPTFGFCASFSNNLGAAFFLAIGTDGTTYVSSTVNPALSGAPYPACPAP